ncbi:MAG: hypothetical protein GXX99_07505 [Clostridiales bacterium]|nr:hypothetical protein [Clostridiales bacterium]
MNNPAVQPTTNNPAVQPAVNKRGRQGATNNPGGAQGFPELYAHRSEAGRRRLDNRERTALSITENLLDVNHKKGRVNLAERSEEVQEALRWMVGTGSAENEPEDEVYRQVMDLAFAVLLGTYRDSSVLPAATDTLFVREAKGQNTHDLVWALFLPADGEALRLIARRLDAQGERERALAKKLLCQQGPDGSCEDFCGWLAENEEALEFTGLGPQFSGELPVFRINAAKKGAQKEVGKI